MDQNLTPKSFVGITLGGVFLIFALVIMFFPLYGLVASGFLLAILFTLYFVLSPIKFVLIFLTTKPLIDLTWRWSFPMLGRQEINIQALIGIWALAIIGLLSILQTKRLVLKAELIVFLALAFSSVLVSISIDNINELLRLFVGVSFFFVAGYVLDNEEMFDRFVQWLIVSVSIPVSLSFLQFLGVLPFEYWDYLDFEQVGRVSGTYQHPVNLTILLIYTIPMAFYLLCKLNSWYYRLFLWLFIGLSLVAMLLTYHRVSLFVVSLGIILWMVLVKRYKVALLIFSLYVVVIFLFFDRILTLYSSAFDLLEGKVSFFDVGFLRGRGVNWYLFLNTLFSSPPWFWIIGRGGSFAEGFVPGYGYWSFDEPHNDFIRILHAYGVAGLGMYILVLLSFFWMSIQLRCLEDNFSRLLGNLMIVFLGSIVIMSLTIEPTRYPTMAWYLFTTGSVITIRYRRMVKSKVV